MPLSLYISAFGETNIHDELDYDESLSLGSDSENTRVQIVQSSTEGSSGSTPQSEVLSGRCASMRLCMLLGRVSLLFAVVKQHAGGVMQSA